MCIHKMFLFTIVASFMVFGHVQERTVDEEFTLKEYVGQWYHMGIISNCEEDLVQQCIMYDVFQAEDNGRDFYQSRIPIVNIPICEYGFPIFSEDYRPGKLIGSRLNVSRGKSNPRWLSTVKSYNNGTELIFTDSASELCNSESHRLWSRNREVSAETKAEFEKLAGDGTANYYSWDDCPTLRSETDDEFTLKQFEGKWYDIAKVYHGDIDNDTCTVSNVVVDYKNQTFDMIVSTIRNGRLSKIVYRGILADSALHVETPSGINGTVKTLLSAVSCNNGAQLIFRLGYLPHYALISRNPKVSAETMAEFRRLSDNYVDAHFTIYPQDNCANRIN